MPIDFSQVQQKLIEKLQSKFAEKIPESNEANTQPATKFQEIMSAVENNGADISAQQQNTTAKVPPLDESQALSPGDRILNHLASMSKQAHRIDQVIAKAGVEGGEAGNVLRSQIEAAKITATAGTATDAVNKYSQSADTLLKS